MSIGWDIAILDGVRFRVAVLKGRRYRYRYFKRLKNALRYAMRKVEEMEKESAPLAAVRVSVKLKYSNNYVTFGPMIQLPAIAQALLKAGEITAEEYERFRRWNKGELSWKDVFS